MGGVAFPARRQTRLWVAHNRGSLVRVQRMQISEQQGAFRRGFGPASGLGVVGLFKLGVVGLFKLVLCIR